MVQPYQPLLVLVSNYELGIMSQYSSNNHTKFSSWTKVFQIFY